MECGICLNTIKKSCVGLCNHHFCFNCMIRWCNFNNMCPKCKSIITEIKFDPEYDILINELIKLGVDDISRIDCFNDDNGDNGGDKNAIGGGNIKEVYVTFNKHQEAGLTITNNEGGPGVKIKRLDIGGRASLCGLKINDIILFINNVPCINHKQCMSIIRECVLSNRTAVCMVFD